MTHVTCRLTAKNRDQLRNPALGNRVWATLFLKKLGFFKTRLYSRGVCAACVCRLQRDAGWTPVGRTQIGNDDSAAQAWSSQSAHRHDFTRYYMYPDGSVASARTYCRNPDTNWHEGVWCFTTDPRKRWEQCSVPSCGKSFIALYQLSLRRWRRGVVVSGVRRMNQVNPRRARLVLEWVTVFGRVYRLAM